MRSQNLALALRRKLKKDGRSLTWFHKNYIDSEKMTRGAMYQQLNKGHPASELVNKSIEKYLKKLI